MHVCNQTKDHSPSKRDNEKENILLLLHCVTKTQLTIMWKLKRAEKQQPGKRQFDLHVIESLMTWWLKNSSTYCSRKRKDMRLFMFTRQNNSTSIFAKPRISSNEGELKTSSRLKPSIHAFLGPETYFLTRATWSLYKIAIMKQCIFICLVSDKKDEGDISRWWNWHIAQKRWHLLWDDSPGSGSTTTAWL